MSDFVLTAKPPFAAIPGHYGRGLPATGLWLQALKPRAMIQVMVRREKQTELTDNMQARFGVALPDKPRLVHNGRISFLWAGHNQWLAYAAEEDGSKLKAELCNTVGATASLSDLSDARFAVSLSGPKARDTLAKLIPLDLHPQFFRPSQTALTLFDHLSGQLTQIDDLPSYELMVFRGFAESLWRSIHAAGAEFGIDVIEAR